MRHFSTAIVACTVLAALGRPSLAEDFSTRGLVVFGNIQETLQFQGAVSPYAGKAISSPLGFNLQTGAILPDPNSIVPIEGGGIQFEGVQGPNPLAGGRELHVITARGGKLFCEWVATFTVTPTADGQTVIFTGDGNFTVVGGTGKYRGATGHFRTLFKTVPTLPTADAALATFTQQGTIHVGRKHWGGISPGNADDTLEQRRRAPQVNLSALVAAQFVATGRATFIAQQLFCHSPYPLEFRRVLRSLLIGSTVVSVSLACVLATRSILAEATAAGVPFQYDFDGTIYVRKNGRP